MVNVTAELDLPKISRKLINELNTRHIRYCHWKSNEHLVPGLQGKTDLDILVHKEDYSLFIEVMALLKIKRIQETNSKIPDIEDWLGFCSQTGTLIHLHVHYSLITGKKNVKEITFPWVHLCLSTSVRDKDTDMEIINPNLEFILLMLRVALKVTFKAKALSFIKGSSPYAKDIQDEIDYLKDVIKENEFNDFSEKLFRDKDIIKSTMRDMYKKKHISSRDLKKLKKVFLKEYSYLRKSNKLITNLRYIIGIKNKYKNKLLEVIGFKVDRRKKIASGGIIVAFIGSDGAGKSTMIGRTNKWLKWKLNVYNIYLGSGDSTSSNVLRIINRLIRKKKKSNVKNNNGAGSQSDKVYKRKNLSFKLFLKKHYFMYIAKEKFNNLYKAYKLRVNGNVVITDRYPQNQFMGKNDSPGIRTHITNKNNGNYFIEAQNKEEALYEKMLEIQPDVVIKLVVTPEEAIRRKPDHDYNLVKEKGEILKKLSYKSSKVYTVDANKSINEVELDIRRIIWENL